MYNPPERIKWEYIKRREYRYQGLNEAKVQEQVFYDLRQLEELDFRIGSNTL